MLNVLAPAPDLVISQTGDDPAGTIVLPLAGVVETQRIREVHRAVIDALRRHRPSRIHLDLRACTQIDAAGLRGLRLCRTDAAQLDCRLDFIGASVAVQSLLRPAGLIETHH
jgi:anti-anti-sigma regulatory factor